MFRKSILILFLQFFNLVFYARSYYVSNNGNDNSNGLSPSSAWKSLQNVNTFQFESGDSILFKRGDNWRGYIIPKSGDINSPIYYGAYGTGEKPIIQGSVSLNNPDDWSSQGDNIWSIQPPKENNASILQDSWRLWTEGSANASLTTDYDEFYSEPSSMKILALANGTKKNHIQLINSIAFSVKYDKIYKLSFFAKSTKEFVVPEIVIHKYTTPFTRYSQGSIKIADITTEWKEYSIYFKIHVNSTEGRLTIFLGGVIPEGSEMYLDDVSLAEVNDVPVYTDVGNIILNNEGNFGSKKWNYSDLHSVNDYYYDFNTSELFLYSPDNPAQINENIEACLTNHLIMEDYTHNVIYENLMFRYSGGYGIKGRETSHIKVSHCDFEYIGGGAMTNSIRYGNAVEFWGNASNNIVEYCTFREIYDAAVSNQNSGAPATQENIIYRYNMIINCEYSFEYWNQPGTSITDKIIFENNTCINAGMGWGHVQRPDPHGYHLAFYYNTAQTDSVIVRNNIFYRSSDLIFYERQTGAHDNYFDYNCWYDPDGQMIYHEGMYYTINSFEDYKTNSGLDANSFAADPGFIDPENGIFTLSENSVCIDTGIGLDPDESSRDIGAFPYVKPANVNEPANYPESYKLYQNYPNPFNPETEIKYDLPLSGNVKIVVYNLLGRQVDVLVDSHKSAGNYIIHYDASKLSSGVYIYSILAGNFFAVNKMVLIK